MILDQAGSVGRRLLFVVNNAAFFISHRLVIGRAAREAGYEVHLAAPASRALDGLRSEGFLVHAIPLNRSRANPVDELRSIVALVRLYRRVRPDIVHHVTIKPVLYGSIAARLSGVSRVVNAVSGLGFIFLATGTAARLRRAVVLAVYRLALGGAGMRVIFQNDDDAALFLERGLIDERQVHMIRGSGVDVERFRASPEKLAEPLVVLVARMLRDKGVHEFVEAASIVRSKGVHARFVLVGAPDPGNPSSVASAQLEAWNGAGVAEWWGERDDVPEILSGAHLVCLPSYREGMPKVLLEAAACGRAVVTTDAPGCRDVVEPGVTGLLVPPRDAEALAAAIQHLLERPELRRAMGVAGRKRAEQLFDERDVARRTLDVYADLFAAADA